MTETKAKPKKKKAAGRTANTNAKAEDAQRLPGGTVGEILRAARLEKGVNLEDVSSVINVRVSQLRAIEEGNIDALPGMTYAIGFVRSYAGYLDLNGADIAQKFKLEHGALQPANQHLHMPEPIADGPQPNILVIGTAVFCAVLVLVLWTVFSGGDEVDIEVVEYIPPAPVVDPVADIAATSYAAAPAVPAPAMAEPPEPEPAPPEPELAALSAALAPVPPAEDVQPPAPEAAAIAVAAPLRVQPVKPLAKPAESERRPVINVRGGGRIVLQAVQSSWVEIKDAKQQSVFKKVLRPGEQYHVPDQPGLSLVTSNAGGLEIYVDGKKVQSIGKQGEIVRGVELDADDLKTFKIKNRNRR